MEYCYVFDVVLFWDTVYLLNLSPINAKLASLSYASASKSLA